MHYLLNESLLFLHNYKINIKHIRWVHYMSIRAVQFSLNHLEQYYVMTYYVHICPSQMLCNIYFNISRKRNILFPNAMKVREHGIFYN